MKKGYKEIVALLVVIIIILSVLVVLFATGKLTFNMSNNISNNEENITNKKENYNSFIGTWKNNETQNIITIKNITENKITFTWFVYRLAGIDDDYTIPFNDGKAVFYYKGYYDENYKRKATLTLDDNGVTIKVEDVTSIDSNYVLEEKFSGSAYVKAGTYTHPEKE